MYEDLTSDFLEKKMLKNVSDKFDKREGSIIYDATAPASLELAEAYIMANVILMQTFASTADREFLIKRASEFNVTPKEATYAEVEAQFSKAVDIGSRFNYEKINFTVTELMSDTDHTYKMVCETAGTAGNYCIGSITPIGSITGLTTAEIVKVITPGETEEDTEVFRERYFRALKTQAFGGNGDDYREKILAIAGIGGVKVYRCWNGGGTVKCVILGSDYSIPAAEKVAEVQTAIDPTPQGQGYGLAPIGHTVTIAAATATTINLTAVITCSSGYTAADLKASITSVIEEHLQLLRKSWESQNDTEYITVRTAFISAKIIKVANIVDVTGITINGDAEKIQLATDAVPILGTVTLTEGK